MKRISATEAAREFSELLNQVRYKGESFIVTRNGEEMCCISPVQRSLTFRGLKELLRAHPWDDKFADDLEQIHREQGQLPENPWPS